MEIENVVREEYVYPQPQHWKLTPAYQENYDRIFRKKETMAKRKRRTRTGGKPRMPMHKDHMQKKINGMNKKMKRKHKMTSRMLDEDRM